jgi:predicted metalloprotease with PDZ domain
VQGHEVPDYARLLARMGLVMRKRAAGKAWLGPATVQTANGGLRVGLVPVDSPLYKAGMAQDDQIVSLAGVDVTSSQAVQDVLARHEPGAKLALKFVRRSGDTVTTGVVLEEDPHVEIVTAESTGAVITPEQRQLRTSWLASRTMK